MANLLRYSRNRCTSVEQLDDTTLKSACRLQDTLTDARVEIVVRLPDLEVVDVSGYVHRTYREECRDAADALKKVIGVRIGAGLLKIIKGLVREETDCRQLGFMVEECCHGVILAFTKETLINTPRPREIEDARAFYADMVKKNIRLYNRCAAFAPGSSLVEGFTPPEG